MQMELSLRFMHTVSGVDISIVGDRCRNLIGQYVKFNPINGNSIEFHYKK